MATTPLGITMKLNLRQQLIDVNAAINQLAPYDSPHLTGIPIAPTASSGTNTTQLATTKFVHDVMANYYTNGTCIHIGTTAPATNGFYTKYLWFDTTTNAECIKYRTSSSSTWTLFGAAWK